MGRTQTFNTAAAVRAARSVFWRRGYEAASLPELEHATGLGRSSLYHAFGSKRGLFDAAVTSYLDEVVRPGLAALTGDDVRPGALTQYLAARRAALGRRTTTPGCLLVNSATAPIGDDDAVRAAVAGYRAQLRAAVASGLAAAAPQADPDEREVLADTVTSLVVSSSALARVDPDGAAAALAAAARLVERAARRTFAG